MQLSELLEIIANGGTLELSFKEMISDLKNLRKKLLLLLIIREA